MSVRPSETTPLVASTTDVKQDAPIRAVLSPVRRVYFIASLTSLSFAITQTTLIYAFRVMTCDEYHLTHKWRGTGDRCALPAIDAQTARSIALMSSFTVFCSILNLFFTGYCSKRFGIKAAMFQQTIWASFRTLCQIYAVSIGGSYGVKVVSVTQVINILGSGGGYQLAANNFVAALVDAEHRTGSFGVMAGYCLFGQALGFVLGGIGYDRFGLLFPFQAAFFLLNLSTISGIILLPYIDPNQLPPSERASQTSQVDQKATQDSKDQSFLSPLKLFIPRRKVNDAGKEVWDLNLSLMGVGVFFSVLATGYVGMGLQLVGTNVFGFGPNASGYMQCLTLAVQAVFLSLCFPRIIAYGRRRLSARSQVHLPAMDTANTASASPSLHSRSSSRSSSSSQPLLDGDESTIPTLAEPSRLLHAPQSEPTPKPSTPAHGMKFDLYFLRYSILLDGILTASVAFSREGWHLFVAATVLPFASGTSSAAKGVTLDFVRPEERGDALNAIALVEKIAQVSTIGLFGYVFAFLSEIGNPTYVFAVNGCIAFVGFLLLLFVRMPSTPKSTHA